MPEKFKSLLPYINTGLVCACLLMIAGMIYYDRGKYASTVRYWMGGVQDMAESVKTEIADPAARRREETGSESAGPAARTAGGGLPASSPVSGYIPFYNLVFDPSDIGRIAALSERLTRQGAMLKKDKVWFKGAFVADGEAYKVKARLRGDLGAHWLGEKKSWRVKFKRKKLYRGYRELNFVIPFDKATVIEPVAYSMARELGLLVPDAGFARLNINNVDYGLYFWYEQAGNEMLEKQGYPEGEIYSGDNVWLDNNFTHFGISDGWEQHPSGYGGNVQKGRAAGLIGERFARFLELVRNSDQEAFEKQIGTFVDLEKVARFSALMWLFGSPHGQAFDNMKFYYDPTVGLFEPVPFDVFVYPLGEWEDGVLQVTKRNAFDPGGSFVIQRILTLHSVTKYRNEVMWRLLQDDQGGEYAPVARAERLYRKIRPHLTRGIGSIAAPTLDENHGKHMAALKTNREALRAWLAYGRVFVEPELRNDNADATMVLKILPDGLNEFRLTGFAMRAQQSYPASMAKVRLELRDHQGRAVPVKGFSAEVVDGALKIGLEDVSVWTRRDSALRHQITEWTLTLRFPGVEPAFLHGAGYPAWLDMTFVNALTGKTVEDFQVRNSSVPLGDPRPKVVGDPSRLGDFIAQSGLPLAVSGSYLVLGEGEHRLDSDLVFPRGYGLRMEAGAVLDMAPGVSILVFGPAQIHGTAKKPVVVRGRAGAAPWGAIGFVNAAAESDVRFLRVSGGSEAWIEGVALTGQLCFYSADVKIYDSIIRDAHADDGLNIKRSRFDIARTQFTGNKADGYDGDWTEGVIRHSRIEKNGGDGIDFSGSTVVVVDSVLSGMGDKGVSVGERSRVTIVNSQIEKSQIGIASKDQSVTRAYGVNLLDNKVAVAVYHKKQVFGPGRAEIFGSVFLGNDDDFTVDARSSLALSGVARSRTQAPSNVEVTDARSGELERHYQRDPGGILYFDPARGGDRFKKGPDVPGQEVLGVAIPNLSKGPVGLFRRLEGVE